MNTPSKAYYDLLEGIKELEESLARKKDDREIKRQGLIEHILEKQEELLTPEDWAIFHSQEDPKPLEELASNIMTYFSGKEWFLVSYNMSSESTETTVGTLSKPELSIKRYPVGKPNLIISTKESYLERRIKRKIGIPGSQIDRQEGENIAIPANYIQGLTFKNGIYKKDHVSLIAGDKALVLENLAEITRNDEVKNANTPKELYNIFQREVEKTEKKGNYSSKKHTHHPHGTEKR
tara:strand:+ start:135 stop:842 length:708 start_codon:yes stop_codon:yes gene_type:complete